MNATTAQSSPTASPALPVIITLAHRELVRFFRQRESRLRRPRSVDHFLASVQRRLRGNQLDYAHFFPGTLVMILLFTAIFATITIIEDRNEGFLQSVPGARRGGRWCSARFSAAPPSP